MNRLPDELQRMIFSFAPIEVPTSALIADLIDCHQNEPLDVDNDTDFQYWWSQRFKTRTSSFNPTRYRCEIGLFACCDCGYELSWYDYNEEGFDCMCGQCYADVYHADCEECEWNSNPNKWDDSDSDEDEDDSE